MNQTEAKVISLIEKKKYQEAILCIDNDLTKCGMMRRCMNYKAECLIGMNEFAQADALFAGYNFCFVADDVSQRSLDLMITIQKGIGAVLEAKRYTNIRTCLYTPQRTTEIYQALARYEEAFLTNPENPVCATELLIAYYTSNFLTEAILLYVVFEHRGWMLPLELKKAIEKREDLLAFQAFLKDGWLYPALVLAEAGSPLPHHAEAVAAICAGTFSSVETKSICVGDRMLRNDLAQRIAEDPELMMVVIAPASSSCSAWENGIQRYVESIYRNYDEAEYAAHYDCFFLSDYLTYAAHEYGIDVRRMLCREAEVDFSIVIPVRNHAEYLPDVLKTCMGQKLNGTYEILISDNSDWGVEDICRYVAGLDCPQIRYVRTPGSLSLPKSFEFAYLNARGTYITSLGADDGMLNHGLAMLERIIAAKGKYELILSNRPVYYWPSCDEKMRNQLLVRYKVLGKETLLAEIDMADMREKCFRFDYSELELPYMYQQIVHRDYLRHMYETTGKLFCGDSQDVYDGVLNLFMLDKALYVNLPITVPGISTVGTGYSARNAFSMTGFCATFRSRNAFFARQNPATEMSRDFSTIYMPYGSVFLMYREFLQIAGLIETQEKYRSAECVATVIRSFLKRLPDFLPDKEIVFSQIQRMAKAYCPDISGLAEEIDRKERTINVQERHVDRLIKKTRQLARRSGLLRRLYFRIRHISPIESSDVSRYGVHSIADACAYLYESCRKDGAIESLDQLLSQGAPN